LSMVVVDAAYSGATFLSANPTATGNHGKFSMCKNIPTLSADSFTGKIKSALDIIDIMGDVYYGDKPRPNTAAARPPFESLSAEYLKLSPALNSIIDQLIVIMFSGEKSDDDSRKEYLIELKSYYKYVEDRIILFIEFLGSMITEKDYGNDLYMVEYNKYLKRIQEIREKYLPYKDTYSVIWTQFQDFLWDFISKNQSTYQTYTLKNVLAVYEFTTQ